jgi:hypothetical protein
MKKRSLMIAALIALTGVAQAVQMSYSDNGLDTSTQSYDTGDFLPGTSTTIPIVFEQFNTQGGTRTLVSVTISATQLSWGGYYDVDNDGDSAASITAQHGTGGNLNTTAGYLYFLPASSQTTLFTVTTSGGLRTLDANDGDVNTVYNAGGSDNYRIDGPAKESALTDSVTGSFTTGNPLLAAYQGSGDLSLDYNVYQDSTHTGEGALFYSGGPASAQTVITVTYNYVPEPTSMALLAIGCAVLGLRRRPRNTLKG